MMMNNPHANPHGGSAGAPGAGGPMGVPDDIDEINDTPTVQEYKRLRRVMRIMVKFYEDGSTSKYAQFESMVYEIAKAEEDEKMILAQLEVLKDYPTHNRKKQYETELNDELESLRHTKNKLLGKQKEFEDLYHWSLGIVEVTKWLLAGLNDYCVNHLKMDLSDMGISAVEPPAKLTREQLTKYKKGLEEISFNLTESQDFFQASIDGRLNLSHVQEKEMITRMLEAIRKFPESNPRRQHLEQELQKDIEFVEGNMQVNPQAMAKRQRMLDMHRDFHKVLKWFEEKLNLLTEEYALEDKEKANAL